MDKLANIYYQLGHLWKGQKATKKLQELSKEKLNVVKQWLLKQAIWKVHLQPPKHVDRPHYEVTIPNQMHQFNLLYMHSDTLYGTKYKYILSAIDVASSYKFAKPMRTKQAADIADMIVDNYKVGPLTYPKVFQCNNGSKFKADVTKMSQKHGVMIWSTTMKYNHTHTAAFVKALNKLLAENLFKVQDMQELNDPKKVSSTRVKHLHGSVDRHRNIGDWEET